MKAKAGDLMERISEPDRAAEFDAMSVEVEDYAEPKGVRLSNPCQSTKRSTQTMARSSGPSKADLVDQLDEINDILSDTYDPESTREDLAAAIGQAPIRSMVMTTVTMRILPQRTTITTTDHSPAERRRHCGFTGLSSGVQTQRKPFGGQVFVFRGHLGGLFGRAAAI